VSSFVLLFKLVFVSHVSAHWRITSRYIKRSLGAHVQFLQALDLEFDSKSIAVAPEEPQQ
jgi:hypothetical protein